MRNMYWMYGRYTRVNYSHNPATYGHGYCTNLCGKSAHTQFYSSGTRPRTGYIFSAYRHATRASYNNILILMGVLSKKSHIRDFAHRVCFRCHRKSTRPTYGKGN